MRLGLVIEARNKRRDAGVGLHLRGIDVELAAPDEPRFLTQIHDLLKEALEDADAQSLPDPGQAGVVRQRLIEGVAEIPPMGEVETRRLDQLPLRANALEEHDQLEFEEDYRIDGGPPPLGVQLLDLAADKAEIGLRFQVAVEVVVRNEVLERDGDRLVAAASLGGAKHRSPPGRRVESARRVPSRLLVLSLSLGRARRAADNGRTTEPLDSAVRRCSVHGSRPLAAGRGGHDTGPVTPLPGWAGLDFSLDDRDAVFASIRSALCPPTAPFSRSVMSSPLTLAVPRHDGRRWDVHLCAL